ncbi:SUN domain-containing protein [Aphelenchoides fujianensis]|nr:SUN domain-containing protein [Aphelenchoides fujianensis]
MSGRARLSPSPRPRSLTPAEVEEILSHDRYTGYTISYRSDGSEEFLHPYLNKRRHVDFGGGGDVSNYRLVSSGSPRARSSLFGGFGSSYASLLASPRVLAKGALRFVLTILNAIVTFWLVVLGFGYSAVKKVAEWTTSRVLPALGGPFARWKHAYGQSKRGHPIVRHSSDQSSWEWLGAIVGHGLQHVIVWSVWLGTFGQVDLTEHFFGKRRSSILSSPEHRPRSPQQHVHFQSPVEARSFRQTSTPMGGDQWADEEDEEERTVAKRNGRRSLFDGFGEALRRGGAWGRRAGEWFEYAMDGAYDHTFGRLAPLVEENDDDEKAETTTPIARKTRSRTTKSVATTPARRRSQEQEDGGVQSAVESLRNVGSWAVGRAKAAPSAVGGFFRSSAHTIGEKLPFGNKEDEQPEEHHAYDLRSRSPQKSPMKTRSQRARSSTSTPKHPDAMSPSRMFDQLGGNYLLSAGDRAAHRLKRVFVEGDHHEPSYLRAGADRVASILPFDDEKRAKQLVPWLLLLLLLLGASYAAYKNAPHLKEYGHKSIDYVKTQSANGYSTAKSGLSTAYRKTDESLRWAGRNVWNAPFALVHGVREQAAKIGGHLSRPDWMHLGTLWKPVELARDFVHFVYDRTAAFLSVARSRTAQLVPDVNVAKGIEKTKKAAGSAIHSTVDRAHAAYDKTSGGIGGFFAGVYEWTAGFFEGFFGRLFGGWGWPQWLGWGLVYRPVEYVASVFHSAYTSVRDFMFGGALFKPFHVARNASSAAVDSLLSGGRAAVRSVGHAGKAATSTLTGGVSNVFNGIGSFFSGAYHWTAGFLEGFFGRLGWPRWLNFGLVFKPFKLARDFVFFVVYEIAYFVHAAYERVISILPERKVVEKVVVHEYRHEYPPNSAPPPVAPQPPQVIVQPIDTDAIRALIKESLDQYDADKTGQPDYALEPSGAELIGIGCTQVYEQKSRLQSMFGIPLYYANYGARTVIQRKSTSITPGECFAYEGGHGQVIVKLSRTINVTAVSYEHLPVILSPEGNINTAPKEFLVWSYQEYHQKGENKKHLLGKFTYDDQGAPLQTFHTQFTDPHFTSIIEFETESNHGAPLTCLYRFRVHGQPVEKN